MLIPVEVRRWTFWAVWWGFCFSQVKLTFVTWLFFLTFNPQKSWVSCLGGISKLDLNWIRVVNKRSWKPFFFFSTGTTQAFFSHWMGLTRQGKKQLYFALPAFLCSQSYVEVVVPSAKPACGRGVSVCNPCVGTRQKWVHTNTDGGKPAAVGWVIITIHDVPLLPAALVLTVCLLINHTDSGRTHESVLTVSNIADICESALTGRYGLLPPPGLQRSPPRHQEPQSRSVQRVPVQPLHAEWLRPGTWSLIWQRGESGRGADDILYCTYVALCSLVPGLSVLKRQSCADTSAIFDACWDKKAFIWMEIKDSNDCQDVVYPHMKSPESRAESTRLDRKTAALSFLQVVFEQEVPDISSLV